MGFSWCFCFGGGSSFEGSVFSVAWLVVHWFDCLKGMRLVGLVCPHEIDLWWLFLGLFVLFCAEYLAGLGFSFCVFIGNVVA